LSISCDLRFYCRTGLKILIARERERERERERRKEGGRERGGGRERA